MSGCDCSGRKPPSTRVRDAVVLSLETGAEVRVYASELSTRPDGARESLHPSVVEIRVEHDLNHNGGSGRASALTLRAPDAEALFRALALVLA